MTTLYYSDAVFLQHDTGLGHPETAARLTAIDKALAGDKFKKLQRLNAPEREDTEKNIRLIHHQELLDNILSTVPKNDYAVLDGGDTILSPHSVEAAFKAVNTVCDAVDKVLNKKANNAFCAIRPPGHHATPEQAMGFCLFNNIAIAAEYARKHYSIQKVAIVDFDVHHGNGTQAAFYNNPLVFYASSHEMPNFPHTGYPQETGVGNIVNVPLHSGEKGESVRKKYSDIIFPVLRAFKPELLLISAGFDAHKDDPLASIMLIEDDYRWLTQQLMKIAGEFCEGRVISALEGGYNLDALGSSVATHVDALMTSSA
ncbi:MAG: histone deacetylase family protein [Methylococcaceae bacterium]|nr:histone deacetylase family protein [Methylococcaceae bacterium]